MIWYWHYRSAALLSKYRYLFNHWKTLIGWPAVHSSRMRNNTCRWPMRRNWPFFLTQRKPILPMSSFWTTQIRMKTGCTKLQTVSCVSYGHILIQISCLFSFQWTCWTLRPGAFPIEPKSLLLQELTGHGPSPSPGPVPLLVKHYTRGVTQIAQL